MIDLEKRLFSSEDDVITQPQAMVVDALSGKVATNPESPLDLQPNKGGLIDPNVELFYSLVTKAYEGPTVDISSLDVVELSQLQTTGLRLLETARDLDKSVKVTEKKRREELTSYRGNKLPTSAARKDRQTFHTIEGVQSRTEELENKVRRTLAYIDNRLSNQPDSKGSSRQLPGMRYAVAGAALVPMAAEATLPVINNEHVASAPWFAIQEDTTQHEHQLSLPDLQAFFAIKVDDFESITNVAPESSHIGRISQQEVYQIETPIIFFETITPTENERNNLLTYLNEKFVEPIVSRPYNTSSLSTDGSTTLTFPFEVDANSALAADIERMRAWAQEFQQYGNDFSWQIITNIDENGQPENLFLGLRSNKIFTYGQVTLPENTLIIPTNDPAHATTEDIRYFAQIPGESILDFIPVNSQILDFARSLGLQIDESQLGQFVGVRFSGQEIVGIYLKDTYYGFAPILTNSSENTYNIRRFPSVNADRVGSFLPEARITLGFPMNYYDYLDSPEGETELNQLKQYLNLPNASLDEIFQVIQNGSINLGNYTWRLVKPDQALWGWIAEQDGLNQSGTLAPVVPTPVAYLENTAPPEREGIIETNLYVNQALVNAETRENLDIYSNLEQASTYLEQHPMYTLPDGTQIPWGYVGAIRTESMYGLTNDIVIAAYATYTPRNPGNGINIGTEVVGMVFPGADGLNQIVDIKTLGAPAGYNAAMLTLVNSGQIQTLITSEESLLASDVFSVELLHEDTIFRELSGYSGPALIRIPRVLLDQPVLQALYQHADLPPYSVNTSGMTPFIIRGSTN